MAQLRKNQFISKEDYMQLDTMEKTIVMTLNFLNTKFTLMITR